MAAQDCPRCGESAVVPIAYGYPGYEINEQVQRGEVVIGGCFVAPNSPSHKCTNCSHLVWDGKPPKPDPGALAWITAEP